MPSIPYDASRDALYTPEKQSCLFTTGESYDPDALCTEFARLAYIRFEQDDGKLTRLEEALARVGFQKPVLFVDAATDTHGFAASRPADGFAIVAFRGTQPDSLTDLATDLEFSMTNWQKGGSVHEGFARAASSMLEPLDAWLNGAGAARARLALTGHSLGAAIATLLASVVKPDALVTIGSPRVGNADFAATLDGIAITRFVDCCDAVTELPPEVGGYVHAGSPTYITRAGVPDPGADDPFMYADRTSARNEYLVKYAWKTGNVLVRDLADHAPVNYVRSLFP